MAQAFVEKGMKVELADVKAGDIPEELVKQGMMSPVWLGRAVARAVENAEYSARGTAPRKASPQLLKWGITSRAKSRNSSIC